MTEKITQAEAAGGEEPGMDASIGKQRKPYAAPLLVNVGEITEVTASGSFGTGADVSYS